MSYCHHCGTDGLHVDGCPTKPLWQMDIRHRLSLEPNRTDALARLLFHDLYCARDEQMFVQLIEQRIAELQKTLNTLRE